jgi:hypothetical protein
VRKLVIEVAADRTLMTLIGIRMRRIFDPVVSWVLANVVDVEAVSLVGGQL